MILGDGRRRRSRTEYKYCIIVGVLLRIFTIVAHRLEDGSAPISRCTRVASVLQVNSAQLRR